MSPSELNVVVGASGGLGNALVRELHAQGKRVRGVTRSGEAYVPKGVEMVSGDASDANSARTACDGAAVVFNCANPDYTRWPELFPQIMESVIEGTAAAGAKLVFSDNLYAYGPVDRPMTEDMPLAATGRKGRTRTLMTKMLMDAHESGKVRATAGRASDFFGPRVTNSALGDRVFPAAVAGKAAQVIGNLDVPHTFSYAPDFARALITLSEHDEALGQVWHVPAAETLTVREMLQMIYEEAGHQMKVTVAPKFLVSLMALVNPMMRELKETYYQFERPFVVDHSKFENAFEATVTPHQEAIAETVNWYREREAA